MERIDAFEKMLFDIQRQYAFEKEQMEKLKAEGKEKTATYRQYLGNRMLYQTMLDKYRKYGLIEPFAFHTGQLLQRTDTKASRVDLR